MRTAPPPLYPAATVDGERFMYAKRQWCRAKVLKLMTVTLLVNTIVSALAVPAAQPLTA
jgi:hypothetical protein